jgi:hypothetical protein
LQNPRLEADRIKVEPTQVIPVNGGVISGQRGGAISGAVLLEKIRAKVGDEDMAM